MNLCVSAGRCCGRFTVGCTGTLRLRDEEAARLLAAERSKGQPWAAEIKTPETDSTIALKWGIEGLTAALAQELPAGLAAVALNPGIIDTRMLRSSFGESAGSYPTPAEWAKVAVPYLASLGTRDNGKSLTVPGM